MILESMLNTLIGTMYKLCSIDAMKRLYKQVLCTKAIDVVINKTDRNVNVI